MAVDKGLLRLPSELETAKKPLPRFTTVDQILPMRSGTLQSEEKRDGENKRVLDHRASLEEIFSYQTSSNHQWELSKQDSTTSRNQLEMGDIDHEWKYEYTPMKHLRSQYLQKNAVAPKYVPQQNL